MNRTLQECLDRADEIHAQSIDGKQHKGALAELEAEIRRIQAISHRMAFIYNSIKRKNNAFARRLAEPMETYPSPNDWRFITKKCDGSNAMVAPGINVNVAVVGSADDIPNTPLYWVKDTKQFGFHINGVLFLGNVGNVYSKSFSARSKVTDCTKKKCDKACRYYHNPATHPKKDPIRNFMSRSWLYTDDMASQKNKGMRHIGNRNTMASDLYAMKLVGGAAEIEMITAQAVHDVLTIMCANQCGLVPGNPDLPL